MDLEEIYYVYNMNRDYNPNSSKDSIYDYFLNYNNLYNTNDVSTLYSATKAIDYYIKLYKPTSNVLTLCKEFLTEVKAINGVSNADFIYNKCNEITRKFNRKNSIKSLVYTPLEYYSQDSVLFTEEYFNNDNKNLSWYKIEHSSSASVNITHELNQVIRVNLYSIGFAKKIRRFIWQRAKALTLATHNLYLPDIREQHRGKISTYFKNMDDESADSFIVNNTESNNYFLTEIQYHVFKKTTYCYT